MTSNENNGDSGAGFDFSRHSRSYIDEVLRNNRPFGSVPNPSNVQGQSSIGFVNVGSNKNYDNRQANSFSRSRLKLSVYDQISSWNFTFAGTKYDDVRDFLDRVEVCRDACNKYDEELFKVIPVMLQDIAFTWWVEYRNEFKDYADFKNAFIKRFSNQEIRKCQVLKDIVYRTQGHSESGSDYVDNLRRMWSDAADCDFSLEARLHLTYVNLRHEYHDKISRKQFKSFDELKQILQDFDNCRSLPELRSPPPPSDTFYPACAYRPGLYLSKKRSSRTIDVAQVSVVSSHNDVRSRVLGSDPVFKSTQRYGSKESQMSTEIVDATIDVAVKSE